MKIVIDEDSRVASDADGTFLNLKGRFCEWLKEDYDIDFKYKNITYHSYGKNCPPIDDEAIRSHKKFRDGGAQAAFLEFMQNPRVYDRVKPIDGSIEFLSKVKNLSVITAMMYNARDHYASKMECIEKYLPKAKIWTSDSSQKHFLKCDIIFEDRLDICKAFEAVGTKYFLIKQPWNEYYNDPRTFTWNEINKITLG